MKENIYKIEHPKAGIAYVKNVIAKENGGTEIVTENGFTNNPAIVKFDLSSPFGLDLQAYMSKKYKS